MVEPSKVNVFNRALGFLGQDPVETLDPSELLSAGRKMLTFVDSALTLVLGDHHWTVAMRHATLEQAAIEGDWRYPYVYLLPNDAIRLTEVANCAGGWEQGSEVVDGAEQRVIRAEQGGALKISYIRRIDWSVLPEALATAVALRLAALACLAITADEDREAKLEKRAREAVLAAIGQEGSQQGGQPPLVDDRYARLRASAG